MITPGSQELNKKTDFVETFIVSPKELSSTAAVL